MQRLARNIGGYKGETIDIQKVLRDIDALALRTNWQPHPLTISSSLTIPTYYRASATGQKHVYISAGIHGDEPASPLAMLKLFQDGIWPEHLNLWLIPCLNPVGFVLNQRENEDGVDLNRDYRSRKSPLVRAHTAWLDARPRFTLSMSLHEDWEANGFYLYELNPDLQPSLSDLIVGAVREVCPIDMSPLPVFRLSKVTSCQDIGNSGWQDITSVASDGRLLVRIDNYRAFDSVVVLYTG